jgi:hypothetical protein
VRLLYPLCNSINQRGRTAGNTIISDETQKAKARFSHSESTQVHKQYLLSPRLFFMWMYSIFQTEENAARDKLQKLLLNTMLQLKYSLPNLIEFS